MININEIKVGDIFSENSHYVLVKENKDTCLFFHMESGNKVELTKDYVSKLLSTANHFTEVVEVTKEDSKDGTKLGIRSIWEGIHSEKVFTVCYTKQDEIKTKKILSEEINNKTEELIKAIEKAKVQKKGVTEVAKKCIEELINNPISNVIKGKDRILKGYKVQFESRDGRYNCVDMEIKDKNNIRPVNINTIKYLIYDNIMYIVK